MDAVMERRTGLTLYWISVKSNMSINHNPPLYMHHPSNNRCSWVVVMLQWVTLCISTSWFQLMALVKSLAGFSEVHSSFMGPSDCQWLVSHWPLQVLLLGLRCWRIAPRASAAGCPDPSSQERSTLEEIYKAYRDGQWEFVVTFLGKLLYTII